MQHSPTPSELDYKQDTTIVWRHPLWKGKKSSLSSFVRSRCKPCCAGPASHFEMAPVGDFSPWQLKSNVNTWVNRKEGGGRALWRNAVSISETTWIHCQRLQILLYFSSASSFPHYQGQTYSPACPDSFLIWAKWQSNLWFLISFVSLHVIKGSLQVLLPVKLYSPKRFYIKCQNASCLGLLLAFNRPSKISQSVTLDVVFEGYRWN